MTGRNLKPSENILTYFIISLAYSSISWPLLNWLKTLDIGTSAQYGLFVVTVFIAPIILGIIFGIAAQKDCFFTIMRKLKLSVVTNIDSAWDAVFTQQEEARIKVKLKNGETIWGYLGQKSIVSSDQTERDIYIDPICFIDNKIGENELGGWFEKTPSTSLLI